MKIANKDGFRCGENAYLIGNEYGLLCVAYGDYEGTALDNAVDAGYMDSELMSDAEHEEYASNGWYDSFVYAGNASEPLWQTGLWINLASERERVLS